MSKEEAYFLTPKKEFEQAVKRDVETRVREGVKAVLEEVLTPPRRLQRRTLARRPAT